MFCFVLKYRPTAKQVQTFIHVRLGVRKMQNLTMTDQIEGMYSALVVTLACYGAL